LKTALPAVLDEGLEANRLVLGREEGGELLPLDSRPVSGGFQWAVVRSWPRGRHGGSARELPAHFRCGVHLARHLVDDPMASALFVDEAREDVSFALAADQPDSRGVPPAPG
jgi:hypothetical protein